MTFIGLSDRAGGKITLRSAKDVTGVTAEIRELNLGQAVASYELTADEIASGEFVIPEVDANALYWAHEAEYNALNTGPESFEVHVTVRYNSAEGEKALEYTLQAAEEEGWSVQYWPDEEEKYDWNYPGYFRFASYGNVYGVPVSVVVGQPDKASSTPERIVLSVSLSIDGRAIPAEECEIREEDGREFLLVKRPDWAGAHGVIHMTVVQQLSDGTLWTSERDQEY